MTRTKVILLVCFVAAFAAGGALGLAAGKSHRRQRDRSWLMAELNLTAQQREQMRQIWSETMEASARQHEEQRRAIAQQRDEAIAALLTPQQQPKYQQILQDYDRRIEELASQRKLAFEQAVEQTKQILTPDQARQYDELLKRQRDRAAGGPGRTPPWAEGRRPRHGGPRGTMPASSQQHAPLGGE